MVLPLDFDAADLGQQLDAASLETLDLAPFGIVRMDENGVIKFYSQSEQELSGNKTQPSIGKNFYVDVAPCMNHPDMRGRIDAAIKTGVIDMEMGWIGDFDDLSREITIRAVSAARGGLWLVLDRR